MTISTILLVPAKSDPLKLLGARYRTAWTCGYRPPTAALLHEAGLAAKPCPVCGSPCRWSVAPTGQSSSQFVCSEDRRHDFKQADVEQRRWQPGPYAGEYGRALRALVVVWDGQLIEAGFLHAWLQADDTHAEDLEILGRPCTPDDVVEIVGAWRRDGERLGRLVCLGDQCSTTRRRE